MFRLVLTVVALHFSIATGASAAQQADLDAIAVEELPATGAPGVSWASIDDDAIKLGAHGKSIKDGDVRVDADTPFPIGSITKSFTAVAILQLEAAGALGLDDPIGDYLAHGAQAPGSITVRQLLNHTSGYSTVQGNLQHAADESNSDPTAQLLDLEPAHPPGTRFEYSNANYLLLGAIIEKASGETYQDYLVARVLAPLGIDTSNRPTPAAPHRPWFGGKRAMKSDDSPADISPAGGLVLSAREMAIYLAMLMNEQDDVLSAEHKSLMMSPSSEIAPFYGLGWFIDEEKGTVWHSGLVPGAEAIATMIPADKKAAVVLVNANSGIGIAYNYGLTSRLTAAALGLPSPAREREWGMKLTYFSIVLLPIVFVAAMLWALAHRPALVAKRRDKAGKFSLWFPLLSTVAVSVVLMVVVPPLFGGSMATLHLYQPDFALAMTLAAFLGPLWALLRLGLAYWGRRQPA